MTCPVDETPVVGPNPPAVVDLLIYVGGDFVAPLEWDDDTNGSVIPMLSAGYTNAELVWDNEQTVGAPMVYPPNMDLTSGIVLADTSPNMVITIPHAVTQTLSFQAAGYTLYVTDAAGTRSPWMTGTATLEGV